MSSPIKYFYKGTDADFTVLVESQELVDKFRKGDSTIPLIDIVSIYKIFISRIGGSEGRLDEASKTELVNQFGSSHVDDVIKEILVNGTSKHGAKLGGHSFDSTNDTMGSRGTH
ncbi:hypothetical protein BABINDRAFT_165275 [Babjeviella inositovora NRRL Y-12698]|uniref:Ribosome maturation protein SDO1/SBDS N-terminal domain-containing protein n=1 Tax=Babjeviella inositovora NRRL Y-12698 TaxID=984486 RepID=A0A1E3QXF5_9ASCO|nr:uncharacterized protein BABINDRAFT_165275 [Babjeviella inositovora NRRL Y-12698]ODQ81752.1 hypothetical protein BABINDRAFT_165275 [Babjeviella inositovora NRRL Y-12698]